MRAGRLELASATLHHVIAAMLVGIALVLLLGHSAGSGGALLSGPAQIVAGVAAGFGIGIVAALLGIAGGELLIPIWSCCSAPTSSSQARCLWP